LLNSVADAETAKTPPLPDFNQNPLVYLESHTQISLNTTKTLLAKRPEGEPYSCHAMVDEIQSSLMIENSQTSRESIRHILNGYAPRNKTDSQLFGMKKGMDFISDPTNRITEASIHKLYQMAIGDYLEDEDKLLPGSFREHSKIYCCQYRQCGFNQKKSVTISPATAGKPTVIPSTII
jgi:Fic family protein